MTLDKPHRVVADVAHGAAGKGRQILERRHLPAVGVATQDFEREPSTGAPSTNA